MVNFSLMRMQTAEEIRYERCKVLQVELIETFCYSLPSTRVRKLSVVQTTTDLDANTAWEDSLEVHLLRGDTLYLSFTNELK